VDKKKVLRVKQNISRNCGRGGRKTKKEKVKVKEIKAEEPTAEEQSKERWKVLKKI
jgi:hypothetical protein